MRNLLIVAFIAVFVLTGSFGYAAEKKSSSDLLKAGVLGAGAGAVGGLASGGKGGDVWKGALAGAGITIVGGALLDAMSGEKVESVNNVQTMDPENAFGAGYKEGFNNGYKQGYTQGYREGIQEGMQRQ